MIDHFQQVVICLIFLIRIFLSQFEDVYLFALVCGLKFELHLAYLTQTVE